MRAGALAASYAGIRPSARPAVLGTGIAPASARQLLELRTYLNPRIELVEDYLAGALVPALNRLGIEPVGTFVESNTPAGQSPAIFVLIPYPGLDRFLEVPARLAADARYLEAGANYLNTPKSDPAYARIDSSLLTAFSGMPRLEVPAGVKGQPSRVFELRIYESHNELKGNKKVEMFDRGEIDVMREVELGPVFFGQGLAGARLPHLTYMLSAADAEAHNKHWDAFRNHPKWIEMKAMAEYADTVSNITNKFLTPTPASQI